MKDPHDDIAEVHRLIEVLDNDLRQARKGHIWAILDIAAYLGVIYLYLNPSKADTVKDFAVTRYNVALFNIQKRIDLMVSRLTLNRRIRDIPDYPPDVE